MRSSFVSFIACLLLTLFATVLFIVYYKEMDMATIIQLLFLMAIAWGIHTIHHYYEEVYYGYDLLQNKWKVNDLPIRS